MQKLHRFTLPVAMPELSVCRDNTSFMTKSVAIGGFGVDRFDPGVDRRIFSLFLGPMRDQAPENGDQFGS